MFAARNNHIRDSIPLVFYPIGKTAIESHTNFPLGRKKSWIFADRLPFSRDDNDADDELYC